MDREERWEMRYQVPTAEGCWNEKVCYPRSAQQKDTNLARIKEFGYRLVSCKKLYPFSTMKNQHNFDLIHSICFCRIHDLRNGADEEYPGEWERLEQMDEKAQEFFCLPLPVAWLPWEKWKEAKELATMAILHRQDACIANGRPDLVALCAD